MFKENQNRTRLAKSFTTFSMLKSFPKFLEDEDNDSKEDIEQVVINENNSENKWLNASLIEENPNQKTLPINDYMKLVKIETDKQRAQRRELLRKRLATLRSEINYRQDVAIYPLYIFPEEILEHVNDPNDLENLAKSSPYFVRIMKKSRVVRLFEKVFPLIQSHLDYDDIQACALVCKQWQETMDKTLGRYFTTDNKQIVKYSNDVNQVLEEPKENLLNTVYCEYCDYSMNLNDQTPLCDNSYCYYDYFYEDTEYYNYCYLDWCWVLCVNDCSYPFAVKFTRIINVMYTSYAMHYFNDFLVDNGHHVCYLDLSLDMPIPETLDICKQLKRLTIHDFRFEYDEDAISNLRFGTLPDHPCLEHLGITVESSNALFFQDKLIQRYSSQLKSVYVERWNHKLYHQLNWDSLKILNALHFKHSQVFRSLKKLNAPNLKSASVWIRDVEECKVETLMQFVNRFPSLESFHLKFPDKFQGFLQNELVNISQGFTSSSSLAKLVIEINKCNLSATDKLRNFLLCFPFLRELEIELYRTPDKSHLDFKNVCDVGLSSKKMKGNKLKISKYFLYKDVDDIYKSYIWEIIPSLQNFTLRDGNCSKEFNRMKRNKALDKIA